MISPKPVVQYAVPNRPKHQGFSLVEVLIATVITLVMMAALAQGFKRLSDSMRDGRATLTLVDRIRSVAAILQRDLEGCTANTTPPLEDENGTGYFEYVDGMLTDYSFTLYNLNTSSDADEYDRIPTSRLGDVDDILMFTARSVDPPFTGKVPLSLLKLSRGMTVSASDYTTLTTISSEYAEVIYFVVPVPSPDAVQSGTLFDSFTGAVNYAFDSPGIPKEYRLCRRILLIRPDLVDASGAIPLTTAASNATSERDRRAAMYATHDLSMRYDSSSSTFQANNIQDLKRRENRFAHFVPSSGENTVYPRLFLSPGLAIGSQTIGASAVMNNSGFLDANFLLSSTRLGEETIMSGLLAFDVQGYDSEARNFYHPGPDSTAESGLIGSDDLVVSPSDPAYAEAMAAASGVFPVASVGDFADVGWGLKIGALARNRASTFSTGSNDVSKWITPLSGLSQIPSSPNTYPISLGLLKSGVVFPSSSSQPFLHYQPCFDSWDIRYESDWPTSVGLNGLDDNGNGVVDDEAEKTFSAPIPTPLPAIRVKIRGGDAGTGVFHQLSVTQDFGSH